MIFERLHKSDLNEPKFSLIVYFHTTLILLSLMTYEKKQKMMKLGIKNNIE